MFNFRNKYNDLSTMVEAWLAEEVPTLSAVSGIADACSYALLSGGKRVRPVLMLAVAELLEIDLRLLKHVALAAELVHTASLIHDDLPALDNDDVRRGQPTVHRKYGESTAILAGDLLIAKAFSMIARAHQAPDRNRVHWINDLADATATLCDGQVLDLKGGNLLMPAANEDGNTALAAKTNSFIAINRMKTGVLFNVAITAPCSLYEQEDRNEVRALLKKYADNVGLLFQVTDDLLDLVSSEGSEGAPSSTAASDREYANLLAENAISALAHWGERGWFLRAFAEQIRDRES